MTSALFLLFASLTAHAEWVPACTYDLCEPAWREGVTAYGVEQILNYGSGFDDLKMQALGQQLAGLEPRKVKRVRAFLGNWRWEGPVSCSDADQAYRGAAEYVLTFDDGVQLSKTGLLPEDPCQK